MCVLVTLLNSTYTILKIFISPTHPVMNVFDLLQFLDLIIRAAVFFLLVFIVFLVQYTTLLKIVLKYTADHLTYRSVSSSLSMQEFWGSIRSQVGLSVANGSSPLRHFFGAVLPLAGKPLHSLHSSMLHRGYGEDLI